VSAVYLIAECLVVVAYHDNFPSGDYLVSMDQAVFARYALVSVVAALAAVLLVLRGRVVELLGSGDWTWKRTVMVGVAGAIVLRGAVWLVLRAVGAEGGDATTEEMMRSVNDHYGLDANLVLMALLTPLTEEIVFRGVLLSAFQRQLAPGWANFAQAALFGLAHAHPVVTPYTFAMGLVAGWMTRRSGTLRPALLMHVCNNAVACVALAAGS
jgi:membrane protease YdiL (CAAX protease family)